MTSSLVGSEMCIRDRGGGPRVKRRWRWFGEPNIDLRCGRACLRVGQSVCLLYTSDAADDM
eukprot:5194305-Prorocentrum_lima.AAC.1